MDDDYVSVITVTPLRKFALVSHEVFTELVEAGFNEGQAVSILVGLTKKKE